MNIINWRRYKERNRSGNQRICFEGINKRMKVKLNRVIDLLPSSITAKDRSKTEK